MSKSIAEKIGIITVVYIAVMALIIFGASVILHKTFSETLLNFWIAILVMYLVTIFGGIKDFKD